MDLDDEPQQVIKKPEPVYILTKRQMKTLDPLKIEAKYFKEFHLKLDPTLTSINNLQINCQSPKTEKALQQCGLSPEQIIVRPKEYFHISGDGHTDKRHKIHQLQVGLARKKVIIERNKLKRELWEEQLYQKKKPQQNLDYSVSSVNITEYAPYKSPTELIESWIENQQSHSEKLNQKLAEIQKKQIDEIEETEEQQEKYKESINQIFEKKENNRQKNLLIKKKQAHNYNIKSVEVLEKMKNFENENLKQSLIKKEKSIIIGDTAQQRAEAIRTKQIQQLEEKQKKYEDKLRQVQEKKRRQEEKIIMQRIETLTTDRSQLKQTIKKKKQSKTDLPLPKLENRYQEKLQKLSQLDQDNLQYVIEKQIKTINKNKSSILQQSKDENELEKDKRRQEQYNRRIKQIEDRGLKVQNKLEKAEEHLAEISEQKRNQLEEKFDRIREITSNNENRFSSIKQQYYDKCDRQMTKEGQIHRRNKYLQQQREKAIEKLRFKQFIEKSKSAINLSISHLKDSQLLKDSQRN